MSVSHTPMPDSHLGLFKEWRTADRQAHALEQVVSKASLAALDGHGEPPSDEDRERAHKMRQLADDLFKLSMAELDKRARANR
jgi:hypothetical protein